MSTDESTGLADTLRHDTSDRDEAQAAARRAAEAAGLPLTDWLRLAVAEASGETPDQAQMDAGAEAAAPPRSDEVRAAAEQAAAAAGLPMGAWLGRLLKEASLEEIPGPAAEPGLRAPPPAMSGAEAGPAGIAGAPQGEGAAEASAAPQIAPEVQQAAEAAATDAGVPVGAWLTELVEEAGRGEPAAPLGLPLKRVATDALTPGAFQTRAGLDPDELTALAESIRARGVLQPIIVRARPAEGAPYEIIAGERRWRAAGTVGLAEVPVLVLEVTDREAMEIALVENLQRHDLSPLEEAEGYRRLVEELGESQDNLARMIGKSRSHVSNTLRLLRLPVPVKALLAEGRLSAGHARAILAAANPEELARRAVEQGLSVRETERQAQEAPAPEPARGRRAAAKDPDLEQIEDELSRLFGVTVKIALRATGDRGTLTVRFKGIEKLHELIERLRT